jgi:tetratricopeptide (TPR) repeat protein
MNASRIAAGGVPGPGANKPCPCGSGRKFKRCCGDVAAVQSAPYGGLRPAAAAERRQLGPLTEAAALRDAADRFHQHRSGLPADFLGSADRIEVADGPTAAPSRTIIAEGERRRGVQLLETGKFGPAITALRRASSLDPSDAVVQHALGRALLGAGRLGEAADALRLAIALRDDFALAHHDLAVALAAAGEGREAIAACRRAITAAPLRPEGHRLLSELLEAAGEFEEAAQSARRAAACDGDTAQGRLDRARAAVLERDLAAAEDGLRLAITLHPNSAELHKALGDVLAKQGRFDKAIEAFDRAVEADPLHAPAHLTAVRIRRCTAADRPRLTRMLTTLRDARIDNACRLFLHFAIGKLLDDLGEYRQAMQHFDLANTIRRHNTRFDRAGMRETIDRLINRFSAAFFAANSDFGLADETPLLIVGMPRSGTTLIEQIVSSHPDAAAGEELFFWSNHAASRGVAEATSLTPDAGRQLAAEYLTLLRRIGPAAIRVTDKQTFNFQQLGLIHLLLPQARIIHCRRNPVDTCLSMYFTFFKGRMPFVGSKSDLAFAYREYSRIMAHWRMVLPRECLLDLDYEQLVSDRETVIRRLIEFCGLEWRDECLRPERNERPVTTASLWQARQPVFRSSVERWRRYEPWLGELRSLLDEHAGPAG